MSSPTPASLASTARPTARPDAAAFRFRSGRLCLDLAATLGGRHREPLERLAQPRDFARWLSASGMLDAPPSVTTGQLIAARDLREAIYRTAIAVINGIALPQGDVATLNLCAAAPPPRPALRLDRTIAWSATDPIGAAVALLSRDAIKLLAGRQAARLRECAQPDCSLLFIDTSRSSGRRWCAMGSCGNREKVRRYRQRAQRASRDGQ